MVVNEYWLDNWYNGDVHTFIAYDDDYEYRLRCVLENGIYTLDLTRVESTSGEEIGITDPIREYASAIDVHEAILMWGEKIAGRWLEENA